jgi:diguanylate cyclase (GGDEF)-like protein
MPRIKVPQIEFPRTPPGEASAETPQGRFEGWLESSAEGRRRWLVPAGAIVYFAVGVLSQETLTVSGVSPLWPGAGVALLFALWLGWRGLAAVFVADVALSILGPTQAEPALAAATATATTLEAAIAAALVVAIGVSPALQSVRDTTGFVLAITVGAAVGAAIGASALVAAGSESDWLEAFRTWWLADTCGAFLVGGLGLVISAGRIPRQVEAAALVGILACVAFTAATLSVFGTVAFVALIPAVTLAATVGRAPGALAAGVMVLVVALPFAEDGASAFADRGSTGILELEFILMALTITTLVLASALDGRDSAFRDLTARATRDELTGLLNRFGLEQRLGASEPDEDVGLILINLDRFKLIRSGLGYEVGDRIISEVAARLADCASSTDAIARLEADEFAVLLGDRANRGNAIALTERMLGALDTPLKVGSHEVRPTASAGIAWTPPDDALTDAAAALHDAKSAGGGQWRQSRSGERGRHPLRRAAELREAIARGELVPHYQPIVSLADRGTIGCEALARWQHPDRGLLGPGEFIPIAEQTGVIDELGSCILHAACETAAAWPSGLGVSVNLSARQLHPDLDLTREIVRLLDVTGLDPSRLELELTETVLLDHADADPSLRSLRDVGVRLALDDFGTGWSSFEVAQRIHVDTVKIDRFFIDRLGKSARDTALVVAMVAMARAMGARIVAEGVETEEQHRQLVELEVDAAQGFLYSKPVPPAELNLDRVVAEPSSSER